MKIFYKSLAVLGWLVVLLSIYISLTWNKKYNAPYPVVKVSSDSAVIARGKYLVYGPMHCATCHVPSENLPEIDAGKEMPLTGGWEYDIPLGIFRSTNLTPDKETGIGNFTDGEIARALRYSVGHNGRILAPFMPYKEINDDDLTAIISFLRKQQPVKHNVEETHYRLLGKVLLAFNLVGFEKPDSVPPKIIVKDTTIEYGNYLVNSLANCKGCHTNRNMKTGEFTGPFLAGGRLFKPSQYSNGFSFVPPNITPDKETGIMNSWSEQYFVTRFKAGRVYKGSPMFWGSYSRMDDMDLIAMYKYLESIDPVKRKVEKTVYQPGEELPDIK